MTAASAAAGTPAGWRVPPLEVAAPRDLLEGGLALLDALASDPVPTLRWYRSTSTAVVLGRGQRLPDEVARGGLVGRDGGGRVAGGDGVSAGGDGEVEVLRRHSGGGAVLLTPDLLSLDVALPAGHPLLGGDLSSVFLPVGRAWSAGLADLGVGGLEVYEGPAQARRTGSPRERLLAAVCFATLGRGEVTIGGRKLVGLSQRRRRQGALVQCGLLRRWRPAALLAALGADPDDEEVAGAAVGLDEVAGGAAPGDDAVVAAVTARLASAAAAAEHAAARDGAGTGEGDDGAHG